MACSTEGKATGHCVVTGISPCGITSSGLWTAQPLLLQISFQVGAQPFAVTVQHPACLWVGWEWVLRLVWEKGGGLLERERWCWHMQPGPALRSLWGCVITEAVLSRKVERPQCHVPWGQRVWGGHMRARCLQGSSAHSPAAWGQGWLQATSIQCVHDSVVLSCAATVGHPVG